MVVQVLVEKTDLLKEFENDFSDVVFFADDVKRFHKLFPSILSIDSFHLKDVECDLSHLDGVQLCGPWVLGSTHETIFVPLVICLVLNNLIFVLIESWVAIVEFNAVNTNFIDILVSWVTRGDTDIACLFEHLILFVGDALVGLARIWQSIFDAELLIIDLHRDVDQIASGEAGVDHAAVIWCRQVVDSRLNGETR